mmetsp:Transcript_41573/g.126028  ORF Transcript_41573/g.126028 Transcript_41573/m.126028 type:complete len:207 (+) Transcript_41573:1688-2308(+)
MDVAGISSVSISLATIVESEESNERWERMREYSWGPAWGSSSRAARASNFSCSQRGSTAGREPSTNGTLSISSASMNAESDSSSISCRRLDTYGLEVRARLMFQQSSSESSSEHSSFACESSHDDRPGSADSGRGTSLGLFTAYRRADGCGNANDGRTRKAITNPRAIVGKEGGRRKALFSCGSLARIRQRRRLRISVVINMNGSV